MMLQVKNCRLFSLLLVVIAMSFLVTSCKKDKDNEPDSIIGNVSKPAWALPADWDLSSSMTAIVKVDLTSLYTEDQLKAVNYQLTTNDMLAAFCGDECLGIGEWKEDYKAYWLYISAPEKGDKVTLKYYSPVLKHIYRASETIPYVNDKWYGSTSEPYTPDWTVAE